MYSQTFHRMGLLPCTSSTNQGHNPSLLFGKLRVKAPGTLLVVLLSSNSSLKTTEVWVFQQNLV
jgi:hypothetical protein